MLQSDMPAGGAAAAGAEAPRADTFCDPGVAPEDTVAWATFDTRIEEAKGGVKKVIFEQRGAEFPAHFSQLATNVVASKYFYGPAGKEHLDPADGGREQSFRQLAARVADTLAAWAEADGLWPVRGITLSKELRWLFYHQVLAFNSPVWFNVGLWDKYQIAGTTEAWFWAPEDELTAGCVAKVPPGEAYRYPQGSACFIQKVDDAMESIAKRAVREMMLFKAGSGTGTDNSTIRSQREYLSGGGRPSGPVSFLRVYDAVAGTTKSGGKTRRAAKMETLKDWHPDVLEFVEAKLAEEKKAQALIRQGYDPDFNGEAYASVKFQNSNFSLRCSDTFLKKAAGEDPDPTWQTRAVTTGTAINTRGEPMPCYDARTLLDRVAEGTWLCGDPGIQYEDTIQRWHTCPNTAPINSSNPCSEYMHIDDSACNLASINLMKFRREDGSFDHAGFRRAVALSITAQDALVDHASYPSPEIAANAHAYRQLGLGYANLGGLIMASGLPYDSDAGRSLAGAVTAIMQGQAYLTSAENAEQVGPFDGFAANREPMLGVVAMHRDAAVRGRDAWDELVADMDGAGVAAGAIGRTITGLWQVAEETLNAALEAGRKHGYRNSQVTVLAPTGTIAFLMDCDTTGVEPDIALVKYKKLAGGGMLKIVNQTVPVALRTLGYLPERVDRIVRWIDEHDTIEGCPDLDPAHLPVFDCAFPPENGSRSIAWRGHLKMMAAVQPFLSGAISKTINMPRESTVADVRAAYLEGWRLGLKAVAIYRDGSKESQPLSTKDDAASPEAVVALAAQAGLVPPDVDRAELAAQVRKMAEERTSLNEPAPPPPAAPSGPPEPRRVKLAKTRPSITHHFRVGTHEGYMTVGFFPDGRPGEVFVTMAKEGSTIGGLMDTIGALVSMGLQYGIPLKVLADKFAHARFEPHGHTGDPDVPIAKSIVDYLFRWLGCQFVPGYRAENSPQGYAGEGDGPSVVPLPAASQAGLLAALVSRAAAPAAAAPPPAPANGSAQAAEVAQFVAPIQAQSDAPACDNCGAITVRTGTCYRCFNCGNSLGCS